MRTTWAIAGLFLGVACSGKSALHSERNDAGTDETDTSVPDASDDAPHDSGTDVPRPDDGDPPLCGTLAPLGSTVPFNLVLAEGGLGPDGSGGGGAGGVSGAGGVGNEPSGCTTANLVTTCRGTARATLIGDSPGFMFADGNALAWVGNEDTVSPPAVAGTEVFIDYRMQETVDCPYCGSHFGFAITIRESEGGDILWLGRNGQPVNELEPESLSELFGTTARLELLCHTPPTPFDCYEIHYDMYEHVLETTPEQRIPYAARTRVETPRGTFDVAWASAVLNSTRDPYCYDGQYPQHRRDFSASRVAN